MAETLIRQDILLLRISGGSSLPDYLIHLDARLVLTSKGDLILDNITVVNLEELQCRGDARLINEKVERILGSLQRQLDLVPDNVLPVKVFYDVSEASIYELPELDVSVQKYQIFKGGNFNNKREDVFIKISRHVLFQAVKPYLTLPHGQTGIPVFRVAQFDLTADLQKALSIIALDPPRPSDDEYAHIAQSKDEAIALAALLGILAGIEDLGSAGFISGLDFDRRKTNGYARKKSRRFGGEIDYPDNGVL